MSNDLNEARIAKLRAEARKVEAEAQEIETRQKSESSHDPRSRFEWVKYIIAGLVGLPGIFLLAQQAFVPMLNSKQERIEAIEDQV